MTASETILEECKDLPAPVVCSFSNLAASGGYCVSAQSHKIFAQPTTLTGSIGVFGVKIDASEAFRKHGIEFDFIVSGALLTNGQSWLAYASTVCAYIRSNTVLFLHKELLAGAEKY